MLTTEVAVLIVDDTVRTRAAASVDRAVLQRVFEEFSRARREREVLAVGVYQRLLPARHCSRLTHLVILVLVGVVPTFGQTLGEHSKD